MRQEAIVVRLNTQAKQYGITSNPFFEYRPSSKQDIYIAFSSNMFDYETENFDYEGSQILRQKNLKEVFGNYSCLLYTSKEEKYTVSKLNRIQNEIKQLEGGRFQNLCDVYLYRKRNWENIVSLGSMDGTDKTTKGIPDTYYFDSHSNRYTLVMYGTRKDATAKLETDIREAIEKSKVSEKDVEEIICCHTSSNITVEKDKELRSLADSIKLTLIGIDTLSNLSLIHI
ncbi:hypothetical protein [Enterococcus sp. 12E11_DIV0728]|uniref:hypothetical protein n=1 Tax=Enterococcus sp. 12E11_DIV0728 TaxID=1834168 RepID=UPI000A35414A|nr:hypothetical protein [Enterococcus sp. 12E11_DIV0728]OTO72008.1 hypothetical protein A5865_002678 [Enterococcus sp. 12E11_DIV0728]